MKRIFDLYGNQTSDLESCRRALEVALALQFTLHESSYLGVYYRWGQPYAEELLLQANFNEVEKEYQDERFKHVKTLLYVNLPKDPATIRGILTTCACPFEFLERKEIIRD